MTSKLVEDTTRKNILEEVDVFQASDETQQWTCPFCEPDSDVYKLAIPPKSQTQQLKKTRGLIKTHMELHKADLLKRMSANNELAHNDKARADSLKRVRLWITGTINDRKLYEEDPLEKKM